LNFHAFRISGFQKRGHPCLPAILTLDPTKFAERKQQRLHIGNITLFKRRVSLLKKSRFVMGEKLHYERKPTGMRSLYPSDTKAFLYYSTSPEKPRIAGELRLRVTSSDDAASFDSGSDLLLQNGRPWMRPLYTLSKFYPILYGKLREDQLVQDDLDAVLSNLPSEHLLYRRSAFLYSLKDTFIVDFSSFESNFFVITEQGVERLSLFRLFFDFRGNPAGGRRPYTGSYANRYLSVLQY
jgi:hypothetical protein